MNRRAFMTAAAAGVVATAGCTGDGEPADEATPAVQEGENPETPGNDTGTPATEAETETTSADTRADPVRSTGLGRGTSERFTALGGPVVLTLTFSYTGMRNSNFIVKALDENGDHLPPEVLSINELLAPNRLADDPGEYRARLVTRFEPGEYFIDVTHAGGPYGDGEWEILVEQPGVPASGDQLPLAVDGYDADVIGPVILDGPTRVTVETLAAKLRSDGDPTEYNYRVRGVDASGIASEGLINSVEIAPVKHSAVWIPEAAIGYFNVHSYGPWKATVEAA